VSTATRAASISAVAALVLAAVWLLWPTSLGGATTYVATHGTSMEPRFSTGDMAILRPAGSYEVGDVVAYWSESLDTIVMHRIVAVDGDAFVTQGDMNDWLDEDRPTGDQILGTLFLRIPDGGTALGALRSPGVLVVVGVAVSVLVGLLRRPSGRHARRLRRRLSDRLPAPRLSAPRLPASFSRPVRARARQLAVGSGAVALLAAVGCGVLATLPVTQIETTTVNVTQRGQFSYAGHAVPGTTYPTGVIATGDTVWTRLARGLTVTFTNSVSGPDLADVRGLLRLDVAITASDGWSTVLTSGQVATLQDGTATATVPVDADRAAEMLGRHYSEIGTPGGSATLTVTPVAQTIGTAQGRSFTAGAPAPLAFTLDTTSLRPTGNLDTDLEPILVTPVAVDRVVPRSFPLLAFPVSLGLARVLAVAILLIALAALGAAWWVGRSGRGGVADQFVVRHADRIVPVEAFPPGRAVIDVSDAESLHRVAERFDTVVLHHAGADEDVFAVRDIDATYRFVVPGGSRRGKPPVPGAAPAPGPASEPDDLTGPLAVSGPGGLWGRFA
jgi:signal peptidase I